MQYWINHPTRFHFFRASTGNQASVHSFKNMTTLLERSLDEIIGENKSNRVRSKPRGSRGGRNSGRVSKNSAQRSSGPLRSIPSLAGLSVPRDIALLAGRRPVIRVRNIHPELNGDDILSLFGSVGPVEFVKFDTRNDDVAYVCFQRDCARSNATAIANFDGKKAMGQILTVESAVSLADRILGNTRRTKAHVASRGRERSAVDSEQPQPRPRREKPTADTLDAELDSYMNQGKSGDAMQD